MHMSQILRKARAAWVDIAWVIFIGLNLLAMRIIPEWQTVPFLIIWVTLTAAYGFRLWKLGSTILTVVIVTLATGGLIGYQVLRASKTQIIWRKSRCSPCCSSSWSGTRAAAPPRWKR